MSQVMKDKALNALDDLGRMLDSALIVWSVYAVAHKISCEDTHFTEFVENLKLELGGLEMRLKNE